MLYRFPEKVFIDTAEDLVGQLQRARLLAFEIYNINLCHCFQLLAISSWLLALPRCSNGLVHRVGLKSHYSWTVGAPACAPKFISSTYQQQLSLPPSTDPMWSIRQSHGARAVVSLLSGSRHMRPSDRAPRLLPEEGCRRCRCRESLNCGPLPGPRPCGRTCAFRETRGTETTMRRSNPAPGTCVRELRDRRQSDGALPRRQSRVTCSRQSHPRIFRWCKYPPERFRRL